MGDATAALSGSGNQTVRGVVWLVSQSQPGNYSTYRGQVWYNGNGWGSWSGAAGSWSASAPGLGVSGSFTIPESQKNVPSTLLWDGTWNIGHDVNGYRAAFNFAASINHPHTSIGAGTAYAYEGAPARIPKPPSKMAVPTVVPSADGKSATVSFVAPANGGSAITGYQIQRALTADFSVGLATIAATGSPTVIAALDPGEEYYWRAAAKNAYGTGPYSDGVLAIQPNRSLGRIRNSTNDGWLNLQGRIRNAANDGWIEAEGRIRNADDTAWIPLGS